MISTAIIAEEFEDEDMPVSQWAVLTIIENNPDIDQSRPAEVVSVATGPLRSLYFARLRPDHGGLTGEHFP